MSGLSRLRSALDWKRANTFFCQLCEGVSEKGACKIRMVTVLYGEGNTYPTKKLEYRCPKCGAWDTDNIFKEPHDD